MRPRVGSATDPTHSAEEEAHQQTSYQGRRTIPPP
jgi:hypothetical protein